MKILSFDSDRVGRFVNKTIPDFKNMFWQEFVWLSAYFWVLAYKKALHIESEKEPGKYKGNLKESTSLAEKVRTDLDALHDAMIGSMPEFMKK
jgi:glutaredoxin 2